MTYRHNPNEGQVCTKCGRIIRQEHRAERRVGSGMLLCSHIGDCPPSESQSARTHSNNVRMEWSPLGESLDSTRHAFEDLARRLDEINRGAWRGR